MNTALRDRYVGASIETASPARLLCMLYDRLVLDLQRAEEACGRGARLEASEHLLHAQEIIGELLASLDRTKWDGAGQLAQVYEFLLRELIRANIATDGDVVVACRRLVEPLRDAWHEAARLTA